MNDVLPPGKAYFRIREVSRILGVEPSVLRYWETEFKSVRPVRTKADQRLYRRQDVQELMTIKTLLYKEFFTIKGAKRQLLLQKQEWEAQADEADSARKLEEIKKGLTQLREWLKEK
ncbi:MAG: MerR family transcriptional regulator [Syntrophus sp. (in: bacteria)]|jgi:DNA-binding transcriptional MerR regulator|nr:MerR family transcriptional regulator [Syntrophus sp. (in: bacteria)]